MVKEKKIEDLIISISSLINEAISEKKMLQEIESNIKEFDIQKNEIKKISNLKNFKNINEKKKSQHYDWNNINFIKKKDVRGSQEEIKLRISKLFKEEMKNWINENLKNIIQKELNKFSERIISEKLK